MGCADGSRWPPQLNDSGRRQGVGHKLGLFGLFSTGVVVVVVVVVVVFVVRQGITLQGAKYGRTVYGCGQYGLQKRDRRGEVGCVRDVSK